MTPEPAATAIKTRSTLVDITNCIGCRACQVACKQWNDRPGEDTTLEPDLGFQNPVVLSAKTLTLIKYDEIPDEQAPGGLRLVNSMWRCLHCLEPACVSSCPTTALERKPDGPVVYSEDQCIGCRYCMWACPWGVPSADWDTRSPKIHKCTHCADRCDQPAPAARNDQPLTYEEGQAFLNSVQVPACVKACPADALVYGDRDEMLAEARRRMAARPGRYVDHIYGEKEAGGTSVLYLSAVPFEKLGFPDVGEKSYPGFSKTALHAVPPAVIAVGALLGTVYAFLRRRTAAMSRTPAPDTPARIIRCSSRSVSHSGRLSTSRCSRSWPSARSRSSRDSCSAWANSTQLSDTYAWGLWIVFDLVWIAIAAGAFATAGLIYVFQRKDLYSMGRSAVLMGLLSYSFVMVTLLADLGQPLHAYQLAIQAPEQSAMFEVSWCVGLYVSVLLIEFLPVPLEYWGWTRAMELWKRWQGAYVAGAVTLFVYVLSRNVMYAAIAARDLLGARVGVQTEGRQGRAHHARHRGRHALDDASELAGLAVPAHARGARAAVVVPRAAGVVLLVRDRRRHRARDPDRDVDRSRLEARPAHHRSSPRSDRSRSGRCSSTSRSGSATWPCAGNSPARSREERARSSRPSWCLAAWCRWRCWPAKHSESSRRC